MIAIIDYGLGNLSSIRNMLKKIGHLSEITADPERIRNAEKLILPGVGAFDNGMNNLNNSGLISLLEKRVLEEKIPILGICLGMQLMTKHSEEGDCAGLGWVDAETVRFKFESNDLKIPHMGWNVVTPVNYDFLFRGFETFPEIRFYHVHSFYVKMKQQEEQIATTNYGAPFTSAFRKANIFGVQFHPEKSHTFGMKLLDNFARLTNA